VVIVVFIAQCRHQGATGVPESTSSDHALVAQVIQSDVFDAGPSQLRMAQVLPS
jgi:hypothetical protein